MVKNFNYVNINNRDLLLDIVSYTKHAEGKTTQGRR